MEQGKSYYFFLALGKQQFFIDKCVCNSNASITIMARKGKIIFRPCALGGYSIWKCVKEAKLYFLCNSCEPLFHCLNLFY